MSLQTRVMDAMKTAMKEKNQTALAALRAIKSEILLAQTSSGGGSDLSEDDELKLLAKLVKQRKDSATIFNEQNRKDLAEPELEQAEIISQFLPEQLDDSELRKIIKETISETGAEGMKDMGKVIGVVSKKVAGRADGKTISTIVKEELN